MKTNDKKQIAEIKNLKTWTRTSFHGNTKKVGSLSVNDIKSIVSKKIKRELNKHTNCIKSNATIVKELIKWSLECKGTGYFKVLIEGNSGIYYASAAYGHSDYNKSRIFDKTAENLRLMNLFNSIINKH